MPVAAVVATQAVLPPAIAAVEEELAQAVDLRVVGVALPNQSRLISSSCIVKS